MTSFPHLKALVLAGGESQRMGSPKHLLPFLEGKPLYAHLIDQLRRSSSEIQDTAMSVHDVKEGEKLEEICGNLGVDLLYDHNESEVKERIGPAAGLLAAHRHDPMAHWLVLACDYPLIQSMQLRDLLLEFEEPVTCFRNRDGFVEPLIGIWSPLALRHLAENVSRGKTGPSYSVKEMKGKTVRPTEDWTLLNTNTKEEWNEALNIFRTRGSAD